MHAHAHLTVTSCKCHPCRARPPGDYESKEPCILWTSALRCPDVDTATERKSGTYLSQNRSRNQHEDNRNEIRRPEICCKIQMVEEIDAYSHHRAAGPPARRPKKKADLHRDFSIAFKRRPETVRTALLR